MAELQQLLFPWRNSVICQAAMDTPFNKKLDLHNLTSQRPLDDTDQI